MTSLLTRLVGLFPAAFRKQFGPDVAEQIRIDCSRAAAAGRWPAMAAWLATLFDLLRSAAAERIHPTWPDQRTHPNRPDQRMPSLEGGGGNEMISSFLQDLRAALRALRREPGFALVAIGTLGLGAGASAAGFGMINSVLLRPLPGIADADELAYVQLRPVSGNPEGAGRGITLEDMDALRQGATLLDGVASYGWGSPHVSAGEGRPIEVRATAIYGDYFEVLGVTPAEGRLIHSEETAIGVDPRIAVISEDLRGRLFGPGARAAGRTLRVSGEPVSVVGVAAGGFRGAVRGHEIDLWVPHGALVPLFDFPVDSVTSRNSVNHRDFVVRPRPGVGAAAVEAQLAAILERQAQAYPESAEYLGALRPELVRGLHVQPNWRGRTYRSLRLLAGIVALVLLIACANVANLLLFRNVTRRGAMATRRALGASSGRIARQQLTESLLLALLGTTAGLGVAWLITVPFRGESLARLPAFEGFAVDGRVFAFAAAVAVVTAVLFGAAPATLAGRFDLAGALRASGGRDTGRLGGLRWLMSATQVAICLTLLVGGLLLTRTVWNLYAVDSGFDIEGISAVTLSPRGLDAESTYTLGEELARAVSRVGAVQGVALDYYGPPYAPSMLGRIGQPGAPREELLSAQYWPVSAGWFELLRIEMVRGRPFQPEDTRPGAPPRVVLTESLARRLFGNTNVVGRTVQAGFGGIETVEIVGVTRELRAANSPDTPLDAFFAPFGSASFSLRQVTVLARTREFDAGVAAAIREAVEAVMPDQPVPDPVPLTARLDTIHAERRIFSRLLSLLSGLAVLLAAVGLYGVISFQAASRTREFAVRLAVGAAPRRVAAHVLGDGAKVVLTGTAAGLLGAFLLSRVLEERLFRVATLDPASYAAAALLFAVAAALACWTPAHAAARVDPAQTLQQG